MRVALVQNSPLFGEKDKNIDQIEQLIRSKDADLYILPECAYTGYQFITPYEVMSLADTLDSPSLARFRRLAREKDAAIVVGFPEKAKEGCYNSSLLITPDGNEYLYRKTHLFYKETLFFLPGNTGFQVYEFRGVNIGLAICFDWFFPESFRTLALKGADIIAHSSNLVMPYCQQADFARALENHVYIATANRIGTESRDGESLSFTGGSVLVSPGGTYLLALPASEEAIETACIDPAAARNKKINPYNDIIAQRRPEYY